MNALPVAPGDVILNAIPARVDETDEESGDEAGGEIATAVHALGNPEGREVLMLEIRRPGPTLRVWDNVRFPLREIDIAGTLAAVPLASTDPASLRVEVRPVEGMPGLLRAVRTGHFAVDLVQPERDGPAARVSLPADGQPRTLHCVRGVLRVEKAGGDVLAELPRGASALLPAGLGAVQVGAGEDGSEGDGATDDPPLGVLVAAPLPADASTDLPQPRFLDGAPVELRFGTSGLRGLVRDMTDLEVYVNTRGFLRYLTRIGDAAPGAPVAVAEDLREFDSATRLVSSPRIARAAARAIADEGFAVRMAGRIPTPALAHHALRGDADAPFPAVMVTGSHIPADRNGIKFYR
jgi:hypothetical protein